MTTNRRQFRTGAVILAFGEPLFRGLVALALYLGFLLPASPTMAGDGVMGAYQMTWRAARLARVQGRVNLSCMKAAMRGDVDSLGLPSQERTVQACLSNDRSGRVQRHAALLFGTYGGEHAPGRAHHADPKVERLAAVAPETSRAIVRALFGSDLTAVLASDAAAAWCQASVLRAANGTFNELWKAALRKMKPGLDELGDPHAIAANEESAPSSSAPSSLLASIDAENPSATTTISPSLQAAILRTCTGVTSTGLFPACAGEGIEDLTGCSVRAARCQFCESLKAFDDLAVDCDDFDDGAANASCAPALCTAPGVGVNWDAAAFDCPRLSDYRLLLVDGSSSTPSPGGMPYDVTAPLFSDYSTKGRVLFVPPGTSVVYNPDDVFNFPVGTILLKTFSFPKDMARPELEHTRVETRILVRRESGWHGLPYMWNEDMTEAQLSPAGGSREVSWLDVEGARRSILYEVPSAQQCRSCHQGSAGMSPIGPNARQLNRPYAYPWGERNQLEQWSASRILFGAPTGTEIPRLPMWNDPTDGTLEERARAYLHGNCAHCHRAGGSASFSGLFLNHSEPLGVTTGLCKEGRRIDGYRFDIVPGNPEESLLIHRMISIDPWIRMPWLGRTVPHEEGIALVSDWISSLTGECD